MPKNQEENKDLLMYKGKPLIRTGNTIITETLMMRLLLPW